MNKQIFDIFKKWREEKYHRDLEKLRLDMADKGLTFSSIRDKEEQWLKDEYEAELNREEQQMVEVVKEKADERKTRKNQRNTNYFLAAVTFFGLLINVLIYNHTVTQDKENNRPYLTVDSSKMAGQLSFKQSDPANAANLIKKMLPLPFVSSFNFSIQNIGKVPAHYSVDMSGLKMPGVKKILSPPNADGIIFPNQVVVLKYDLQGVDDPKDEKMIKEKLDKIMSLKNGDNLLASKIIINYNYVGRPGFEFETIIEEKMVEKNCDSIPTSQIQCFQDPEWIVRTIK